MSEPGITQTEVMKLNKPDKGYFEWDVPLNENWDKLDKLGAGQLPLLTMLETRHKLQGDALLGWALQGSELDGDIYTSVWELVYAASQRASTQLSGQINGVTYYWRRDEVTGMIFVDSENYNKGLTNLGDSLGYICTYENEVKYIRLPADISYNKPMIPGNDAAGETVPGGFIEAGLPDVQGYAYDWGGATTFNGAFQKGSSMQNNFAKRTEYTTWVPYFKLSNYNPLYGKSDTVQPQSHKVFRYYKVGNTVANAGQIDMGNVLDSLGNKADKDLSNISDTAKVIFTGSLTPNWSAGISIGINTSGTAVADGWIVMRTISAATTNSFNDSVGLLIAGQPVYQYGGQHNNSTDANAGMFYIGKGQPYQTKSPAGGSYSHYSCIFFPCKGAN